VKVLIANIAEFGKTVWSAFTTALDAVSPLFAALFSGGENVGGLTTLMNMLRMAMAAVSDVAFGLNIGFKTILASIQFLAGGVYALSSAILGFLGLLFYISMIWSGHVRNLPQMFSSFCIRDRC
jgi:hypothetical protein